MFLCARVSRPARTSSSLSCLSGERWTRPFYRRMHSSRRLHPLSNLHALSNYWVFVHALLPLNEMPDTVFFCCCQIVRSRVCLVALGYRARLLVRGGSGERKLLAAPQARLCIPAAAPGNRELLGDELLCISG